MIDIAQIKDGDTVTIQVTGKARVNGHGAKFVSDTYIGKDTLGYATGVEILSHTSKPFWHDAKVIRANYAGRRRLLFMRIFDGTWRSEIGSNFSPIDAEAALINVEIVVSSHE